MRFIQREGEVGAVDFTGDAARLSKDGEIVVDWTTGGRLAGVPHGAGYVLEVRTGAAVTVEAVSIGVLVIAMGQSNMDRWFVGATALPGAAGTCQLVDGAWGEVQGAGARTFTAVLSEALGAPVAIVNAAVGDTSLVPAAQNAKGCWLDTQAGSIYASALAAVAPFGGRPELMLWSQGERDGNQGVAAARYEAALAELLDRARSDLGGPVILISELATPSNPIRAARYEEFRAAQRAVAAALDRIEIGSRTLDLEMVEYGHLSSVGYAANADRMAIAAAAALGASSARGLQAGTMAVDTLIGTAGRDLLTSGEGADHLDGDAGDDLLRGEAGADRLAGGAGSDALGGGYGDDAIEGGDGTDEICGDAGNDRLTGGAGDDVIAGGEGDDIAVFTGPASGYAWSVRAGAVVIQDIQAADGDEGTDTLTGIEILRFADRSVRLAGTPPSLFGAGADLIDLNEVRPTDYSAGTQHDGLAGDDHVILPIDLGAAVRAGFDPARGFAGGDGNDRLAGGTLDETLFGGAGDDLLSGGAGRDAASYAGQSAPVVVHLKIQAAQDTGAPGWDTLTEIEDLIGGAGADRLHGDDGANRLSGGAGDDRLESYKGDDTLAGGDGRDMLFGGRGDDRLAGGQGQDRLTGGDGQDLFVFLSASDSPNAARDTITDFAAKDDRIDLGAIDADLLAPGDQSFHLIGDVAFSGVAGELRLGHHVNGWIVAGDIDGDRQADMAISVNTTICPDATCFIL